MRPQGQKKDWGTGFLCVKIYIYGNGNKDEATINNTVLDKIIIVYKMKINSF